jgi:hypothetical protein
MLPYDSISKAITARHVMTPIESAVSVRAAARAGDVLRVLAPHRFDQAPVTNKDQVVGFVTRESAEQAPPQSKIRITRLASPYLVSADAPVGTLLRRLATSPMVFAVEPTGLAGFVTPSDLNKQPIRVHFYMLLADLEMTMASLARSQLPDPASALDSLTPGRREKAISQWRDARRRNIDADVLTAFQFSDLLTTIRKAGLHSRFGVPTQTQWHKATRGLTSFRDQVMHPTSEFLGTRTIEELITIEASLRSMLIAASQDHNGAFDVDVQVPVSAQTQPVTRSDLSAGRIRIPVATKPIFPSARGTVSVMLRGMAMNVAYDPRNGLDRSRSGVMSIGRGPLSSRVAPGERLTVSLEDGVFSLE